ncbi:hypothetical protein BCR43DRAFT_419420, partial [Syncephalastrum racemosum]
STNIQVKSASSFCTYLPAKPGLEIGGTEGSAEPFCTDASLAGSAGHAMPSGFIKTAHFQKTSTYSQITGTINRAAYKLSASDGGGQYDNRNEEATCNGYKYWVNLIEPDIERFCIRCCQKSSDCNLGRSEYGCERVVPGDYS